MSYHWAKRMQPEQNNRLTSMSCVMYQSNTTYKIRRTVQCIGLQGYTHSTSTTDMEDKYPGSTFYKTKILQDKDFTRQIFYMTDILQERYFARQIFYKTNIFLRQIKDEPKKLPKFS